MRTVLIAALALGLAPWAAAQAPSDMPDLDALAARLAERTARIREGEIVLLRGHQRDAAVLEALAIRVRAAGGFPVLSYTSDRLAQGLVDQVPERHDAEIDAAGVRLAAMVSAVISIDAMDDPGLLNHVPPARLAARERAEAAIEDLYRRAGVRRIVIGNGLYPTSAGANQYTLTKEELSQVFWGAVAAEPWRLQGPGVMVQLAMEGAAEARITNPNGTDLKFKIQGRPSILSDGLVSDEADQKIRAGAAAAPVWLPAGEVLVVPVAGTAEGRVVVDTLTYRGREITALNVQVKGGKVTGLSARIGIDALRPHYDAAAPGKDQLSMLSIGVNPETRLPAGVKPGAPSAWGVVSVGLGNNARAGGDNTGPFGLVLSLPGSTLLIDGKPLVENGRLVMPTSPLPEPEPEPQHTVEPETPGKPPQSGG